MLYCHHAVMYEIPSGLHFTAMNFSVHALMYYYFLAAVCKKPPSWGLLVTICQLSQMGGGIYVTVSVLRNTYGGRIPHCDGYLPNTILALIMYASYFYLFAD